MSEINSHFELERSGDGQHFDMLTRVPKAETVRNASVLHIRRFCPMDGVSFYRLKQVDYDGKYEIFDPVSVKTKEVNRNSEF